MRRFKIITAMEALRQSQNMSQSDLANKIGQCQSNISYYETGSQIPTLAILDRIARALDYPDSPNDLLKPFWEVFSVQNQKLERKELLEFTPTA